MSSETNGEKHHTLKLQQIASQSLPSQEKLSSKINYNTDSKRLTLLANFQFIIESLTTTLAVYSSPQSLPQYRLQKYIHLQQMELFSVSSYLLECSLCLQTTNISNYYQQIKTAQNTSYNNATHTILGSTNDHNTTTVAAFPYSRKQLNMWYRVQLLQYAHHNKRFTSYLHLCCPFLCKQQHNENQVTLKAQNANCSRDSQGHQKAQQKIHFPVSKINCFINC